MQPWMNAQQSAQQASMSAHQAHMSAMQHANAAAHRAGQSAAEQARIAHHMAMQSRHHHYPRSTGAGGVLSAIFKFVAFLVWLAILAAALPIAANVFQHW